MFRFYHSKASKCKVFENFGPIGKKSASGAQKTRKTTTKRPPFPICPRVSLRGERPGTTKRRFLCGTGRFVFMEK